MVEKNAYISIVRAKGRNILIVILVFLIAVSGCVALSVRNSAEAAKETAYNSLSITAQISTNRQSIMGGGRNSADLTVIGYSSNDAMTSFINGENAICEGTVFDQDSTDGSCVISYELAVLNDLVVGDTITVLNPSKEDQTYTLKVCGIFQNETTDSYSNTIFTTYAFLDAIVEDTERNAEEVVSDRGTTTSTALRDSTSGTYVFYDVPWYEDFCADVESMGLDTEVYTVSSADLNQYEKSVVPLESLSKFTMIFFIVVLLSGGCILVIFNMFTVRERKYEIGVLAAIGMKKGKVALQFLTEAFLVTLVAIVIGTGVGAAASLPVGDYLLQEQVTSVQAASTAMNDNFGGGFQGMGNNRFQSMGKMGRPGTAEDVEYLDSLNTTTDLTVLASLMGISILLTLIASSVGMISVLRYGPLKILSER